MLLDERGKDLTSEQLAVQLQTWRDGGIREARFVLGAADGHSKAERDEADLLMAFGTATWPHLLARAMLMEQLYRATSILAGHPYHRAG
jgi:23S rRNA (pseudouridine1915-N3)-methyltransferase